MLISARDREPSPGQPGTAVAKDPIWLFLLRARTGGAHYLGIGTRSARGKRGSMPYARGRLQEALTRAVAGLSTSTKLRTTHNNR